MNPMDLDRVFGRSRLRMVTGAHVEVFREESAPGERRRYTKRFLATPDGDFRLWTEREWRILARLMGHGVTPVPDVVQFDRGAPGRPALVQTYDAGITVDHWATLLPLARDGTVHAHVFEDCAHWWALARHALIALDAIHALDVVHLDLKADNVCIPYAPADADPMADPHARFAPRYEALTLIDFAFSLVSGEPLLQALPIARQPDYPYQSPRLLQALEAGARGDLGPTQRLDWRCDLYSLAAMLRRYLPDPEQALTGDWNHARHAQARALVRELIAAHDAERAPSRPHARWIGEIGRMLEEPAFAATLARGWSLAWTPDLLREASPTPITRIALPVPRERRSPVQAQPPGSWTATPPWPPTPVVTPWPAPPAGTPRAAGPAAVPWTAPSLAGEPDARAQPRARVRRRASLVTLGGALLAAAVAAPVAYDAWRRPMAKAAPPPHVAVAQASRVAPVTGAPASGVAATSAVTAPGARAPASSPADESVASAIGTKSSSVAEPPFAPSKPAAIVAAEGPRPTPAQQPPAEHKPPVVATREPAKPAASPRLESAPPTSAPAKTHVAEASHAASTATAHRPAHAESTVAPRTARAGASAATTKGRPVAHNERGRAAPMARFDAPYGAGALRPTAASIAAAHAPAAAPAADAASPLKPALPPRIVAMLAATKPTAEGAPANGHEAPASGAPIGSGATPAAPAPTPTPFPANAAHAPPAGAIQRASFGSIDYAARAHDVLATHVPRVAQRAERLAARALFLADHVDEAGQLGEVLRAADGVRLAPQDPLAAIPVASADARSLGDASRAAVARRADWNEALDYQVRAFGANPLDATIAGQLAALQLQRRPVDVLAARTLALHALALHDASHPGGRIEDWATLAVANALAGRDRDARAAWLVTLALAPGAEHACRVAMDAYATWGERVRDSVETLVYRAHEWNRDRGSRDCEWPPRRMAGLAPR